TRAPAVAYFKVPRLPGLGAGFALFIILFATVITGLYRSPGPSEGSELVMLAVLPFVNREQDTDNRFLAEGLRESLVHGLSKLSDLQVYAPDDSSALRGRRTGEILQHGEADHILQGSVQTADGHLRVTVQLVRVADGIHQYSDQFDLPLDNLFGMLDEIVSNVVRALSIHLDERERSQMLDWGTTDAIAYENFLRGEFYNNQ